MNSVDNYALCDLVSRVVLGSWLIVIACPAAGLASEG